MKHLLIVASFLFILIGNNACAQKDTTKNNSAAQWSQKDSVVVGQLNRIRQHTALGFKLYPTDNIWTFLELETSSGKIWQVQYSIKGPDYRFKTPINIESLVSCYDDNGEYAGRFELYKTKNIYNFILLDTSDGRTWQVQWSMNAESRMILSIY